MILEGLKLVQVEQEQVQGAVDNGNCPEDPHEALHLGKEVEAP